jgi:formylglycine-generating enzyme required for sulfatase activity
MVWRGWALLGPTVRTVAAGVLAASVLLLATAASAADEKRVALVIGISNYRNAPKLANPANDARRMAEAFRRLGFEVDEESDPDQRRLGQALRVFGMKARTADWAVIFYAGHGAQVDHENYLIPSDAKLERDWDLPYEGLHIDLPLREVSQAKKVGILILDACRNSPFTERNKGSVGTPPKGLARVDRLPSNTLVAMATKADEIAEEGSGENSPFTQAILEYLQVPGLELGIFFRSVHDAVLKMTNFRQEPYVFSSLSADNFFLNPRPPNRPPVVAEAGRLDLIDTAGATPLGLARPTDPDNDPLTVRIVGLPAKGEIRIDGKPAARDDVVSLEKFMSATYTPAKNALGDVGPFRFQVDDGRGGKASGEIAVTVLASNQPPVVDAETQAVVRPAGLGIALPSDPDGDPLAITITSLPVRGVVRNGAVILRAGDHIRPQELVGLTFIPSDGATGDAGTLAYAVEDGRGGRAEAQVRIRIADASEAEALVSESALWSRVSASNEIVDLDAYLTLFPNSRYVADARQRILALAASQRQAGASSPPALPRASALEPKVAAAVPVPPPRPAEAAPTPARPAEAAAAPPQARPADAPPAPATTRSAVPPPPQVAVVPAPSPPAKPVSKTLQDCELCPILVPIPAGTFRMGMEKGDPQAMPAHEVKVRAFALGSTPVTVAEWKACLAEKGCGALPRMAVASDRTPIHNVSWDDAKQYLAWLSKKTSKKYRLPSEAEWEYASRAGTATRYWWGDEIGVALADCVRCGGEHNPRAPLPVASFRPNPFGLHDMNGSVAQWTEDCWVGNYAGAPVDGSAREGKCSVRTLRGGSFRGDEKTIASAARNSYDASVRYLENGFRVARDLD